jgi:hypothetical protein
MQEREVTLSSGRTVTVFNVVVFVAKGGGGMLTVQYATSLDRAQADKRRSEAAEIAAVYGELAEQHQLPRVSAQICNTLAAARMVEAPEEMFFFERRANGDWTAADDSRSPHP